MSVHRWERLTDDELRGASYALNVLRTSPVIRGRALEVLDEQIGDVLQVLRNRFVRTVGPEVSS